MKWFVVGLVALVVIGSLYRNSTASEAEWATCTWKTAWGLGEGSRMRDAIHPDASPELRQWLVNYTATNTSAECGGRLRDLDGAQMRALREVAGL
jgi:hypothetical protein